MNEMVTRDGWLLGPHPRVRVTQAAEGLPRYRWTVAQIDELTRLGVFQEQGGFELIGGEIVPMQSKGARHERVKMALLILIIKAQLLAIMHLEKQLPIK